MIDEALEKDIYKYSTGDCWFSWALQVGLPPGRAWGTKLDLTSWEACPRNGYPSYETHANGRICAAHHLIAGPRHKNQDNSIKFCKCPLKELLAEGCSCGGE